MEHGALNLNSSPSAQPHMRYEDALWNAVCMRLRVVLGEDVYRSWLKPIQLDMIDDDCARLSLPTRFIRDWVHNHYSSALVDALSQEDERIRSIDLIIQARPNNDVASSVPAPIALEVITPEADAAPDMGASLDPRYTFDRFVVGKPNELAYAAAKRIADSSEALVGCNPLFLYGGVGLGKTHLMHAIAWHVRLHHPQRRVVYLSAEQFMYQFIKALQSRDTLAFKEQFRSVDVLMVDDVQFISGKDSTQEEFFHTFNALVEQNKQLVISADRSPTDLSGIEERIRSRLAWGLVADIHTTSFELRYGILESKVAQQSITVPRDVLEFLARRITSNVRELEGALTRVVAQADMLGMPVTLEGTQILLQDLLRSCDRRVSIEDIQKFVADYYRVKVSDMFSPRRSVSVARPRQVAMYLSKILTDKSLPEIGRKFGGKDHTTVMHAVKRITDFIHNDPELREDVERIQRMMGA